MVDFWWADPIVASVLGLILALTPVVDTLSVEDHSGFNQAITALLVSLLTLEVLAITIGLSRDLSDSIRGRLASAASGYVASLFGSLAWVFLASLCSCFLFVVDATSGMAGYWRTVFVIFAISMATLATIRIGALLAMMLSAELRAYSRSTDRGTRPVS